YAAVNAAVDQAKAADGVAAGRFVNGLLRNVLRSKDHLPEPDRTNPVTYISVMTAHPEWMVRRWLARFGEEATLALCRGNNETPPMTLRVNCLKTTRDRLSDALRAVEGDVVPTALSPEGLIVKGVSVTQLPAFGRGEFYIQDEGAQLAAYLVNPEAGERILDVCAAPGGKTTHLAELSGGRAVVTATDIDDDRLNLLKDNVARLETPGVHVEKMETALSPGRLYDKIIVDAPCSALGILRRIPEGKWWKKVSSIQNFAATQLEILESVLLHLKTGGRLIYVTCSTEREENEDVVEAFSKEHQALCLEDPSADLPPEARGFVNEQGYFTTMLNSDRMDRFFAVRWIKKR
ncbi:MAG: 16S rRNA (cytosine(967)-C(5))-methyltransferase RsmB, partial [Nitrospiria bacterium]